ncbi:sugar ABC transporter permease, partial [Candidatus Kapabacteria bacterium]|nr:sugar ABC transporter permease [Candidatus Kapabacteria bacterium]
MGLLIPWFLVFSIFWLYPLIYSFILSLGEYKSLTGEYTFLGFDNYIKVFNDDDFWNALLNTSIFTIGTVPITAFLSLILAVLINNANSKIKGFLQGSYFLPSVTSLVVISLIFTALYQQNGYINTILKLLNIPYPENGFLLSPSTALLSVMAMEIWISTGYYTLLFLAALQTIPKELYESATLMGANKRLIFSKVTLPLVKPTMLFVLVINTIKSFQVFV